MTQCRFENENKKKKQEYDIALKKLFLEKTYRMRFSRVTEKFWKSGQI